MSKIINHLQLEYISSFRIEGDELLQEMEKYAKQNEVPIFSWLSVGFLEQLIRIQNPKRVLEIGMAIAYSTIRVARLLKKKSEIHTIEKSEDNIGKAKEFIEKSGVGRTIKILEGDAINVMPRLKKKYDLIFLDADKEDYKRLFDYSMILLKRGGTLVVDNLLWHGYAASTRIPAKYKKSTEHIRSFNKLFMNQPNLNSVILPIGDGIGLGVKN